MSAKQKTAHNYVGLQRNPVRTYPTFVPKGRIGARARGYPLTPKATCLSLKIVLILDIINDVSQVLS